MVENLMKLLPDDIKIEEILYCITRVNKERERKRVTRISTGRPVGRPKKGIEIEDFKKINTGNKNVSAV